MFIFFILYVRDFLEMMTVLGCRLSTQPDAYRSLEKVKFQIYILILFSVTPNLI